MSRYAQGESKVKENRNADFLSSLIVLEPTASEPVKKSKKKSKKNQVAMDATWAAVVTGSFGLLMFLIEKGRRENVRDHGYVRERLDDLKEDIADIDADIANVEHKIDGHLNDHLNSFSKKKQK